MIKIPIRSGAIAVAALVASACPPACPAGIINVAGVRNGQFGAPLSGNVAFAADTDLLSPGNTYQITATGTVTTGGFPVGPDGLDGISRGSLIGGFTEGFTPLEEGILDSGGFVPANDPMSTVDDFLALIAVFVPTATEAAPGFLAINVDAGGSLQSTDLFLVGNSTLFTASEQGRLYFGVNEGFTSNNGGAFTVTTQAVVPEPRSTTILAIISVIAIFGRTRRTRSAATQPEI